MVASREGENGIPPLGTSTWEFDDSVVTEEMAAWTVWDRAAWDLAHDARANPRIECRKYLSSDDISV